jgi:hypothetical protein
VAVYDRLTPFVIARLNIFPFPKRHLSKAHWRKHNPYGDISLAPTPRVALYRTSQ